MLHKYFLPIVALLAFGCSNAGERRNLNQTTVPATTQDDVPRTSQVILPDSALAFIRQHFGPDALHHVTEKKPLTANGTFYEAELLDSTEIDFGKTGNWIEVNAEEPNHLPTSFFPEAIRTYLETNFNGVGVESIDKDAKGYELELANDVNLHFDENGMFTRKEK